MLRSRGYLTYAFNAQGTDYLRMAYCLALSLRATQSTVRDLSVVVPEHQPFPDRYRWAFDQVIAVADDGDQRVPSRPNRWWRVDNYLRLYGLTPYQETATLDADTLFFDDVSPWWDTFASYDVLPGIAYTYRGEPITYNPLRKRIYEIGLPDLHNGFLYFRRGRPAERLFDVMNELARDWPGTCARHFGRADHFFSSDSAMLLALRETGMERIAEDCQREQVPRFIHMKACLQGWPGVTEDEREWRTYVKHALDGVRLRIGTRDIGDPFHYHVRDFITDSILARYEAAARARGGGAW